MKIFCKKKAFSLLELILAMTIFTVIGVSLYSMSNVLINLQTSSLGIQHFKNEGYQLLERLEKEISEALCGQFFVLYYDENSKTIKQENVQAEFFCDIRQNCFSGVTLPHLFFTGVSTNAKECVQQLFYSIIDYNSSYNSVSTTSGTMNFEKFLEQIKMNSVIWDEVQIKERILYLTKDDILDLKWNSKFALYTRVEDEPFENKNPASNTDKVDLRADIYHNGGYFVVLPSEPFSPITIYNVEYLFWGDKSISWSDRGNTLTKPNTPIRSWDSSIKEDGIHDIGELPRAMKIFLTLTYNPEMYHSKNPNPNKNQLITFEKVIVFKNYRKLT